MSGNGNHFCFPLYLQKVENGVKGLETNTIITDSDDDAEVGFHSIIFIITVREI